MKNLILLTVLMITAQTFASKEESYKVPTEITLSVKELIKTADKTKTARR